MPFVVSSRLLRLPFFFLMSGGMAAAGCPVVRWWLVGVSLVRLCFFSPCHLAEKGQVFVLDIPSTRNFIEIQTPITNPIANWCDAHCLSSDEYMRAASADGEPGGAPPPPPRLGFSRSHSCLDHALPLWGSPARHLPRACLVFVSALPLRKLDYKID